MSLSPSLPMLSSAKNATKAIAKVRSKYKIINAEPPLFPTIVGNFQALPRPTAEPAIARTKPIFENFSFIIENLRLRIN